VRGAHLKSEEINRDTLKILRCKNEHRNDENYDYSQIDPTHGTPLEEEKYKDGPTRYIGSSNAPDTSDLKARTVSAYAKTANTGVENKNPSRRRCLQNLVDRARLRCNRHFCF
jgi:hypothetical protein